MVNVTNVEALAERARLRQTLPPPKLRRAIRESSGATQIECAEVLNVSRQTFIRWENGERVPRRGSAEDYARLLIALRGGDAA